MNIYVTSLLNHLLLLVQTSHLWFHQAPELALVRPCYLPSSTKTYEVPGFKDVNVAAGVESVDIDPLAFSE